MYGCLAFDKLDSANPDALRSGLHLSLYIAKKEFFLLETNMNKNFWDTVRHTTRIGVFLVSDHGR